jgi:hypothetical protein
VMNIGFSSVAVVAAASVREGAGWRPGDAPADGVQLHA